MPSSSRRQGVIRKASDKTTLPGPKKNRATSKASENPAVIAVKRAGSLPRKARISPRKLPVELPPQAEVSAEAVLAPVLESPPAPVAPAETAVVALAELSLLVAELPPVVAEAAPVVVAAPAPAPEPKPAETEVVLTAEDLVMEAPPPPPVPAARVELPPAPAPRVQPHVRAQGHARQGAGAPVVGLAWVLARLRRWAGLGG